MGKTAHFGEYHWQQVLAGALRAIGCDRQMARSIAGAIYGVYGRTDVLDMHNFVQWVSRDEPTQMGGEVESLIRDYLDERKAA
jgi:hypothetical protein